MSVREELAAALVEVLPSGFDVRSYYKVPDELEVDRPVVMLYGTTVRPGAARGLRQHEVTVWLLSPVTDPELVDDDLDAHLELVLAALDAAPILRWIEAERGVLDELYPGYRITLTLQHTKG